MSTETVAAVVQEGNCMGCGTCEAACPTGAVRIELDSVRGVYHPTVAEPECTGCGLCLAVCPGREVHIDALAHQFLETQNYDPKLGRFRRLILGHACNERVRYHGASGGLVTALLVYALEQGLIDGALVLGHEPDRPLITRPYIARCREEIPRMSCSATLTDPTGELLPVIPAAVWGLVELGLSVWDAYELVGILTDG